MRRTWTNLCVAAALLLSAIAAAEDKASGPAERSFCKAEPGYRYDFPKDHFDHPCYRTEWWYFTGNVSAPEGRRLGFELTFFREGLDKIYPNPSRWRVDDLYLAHFAVSDLANQKFFFAQSLRRAGPGLAGVDSVTGRIWNGLWKAVLTPSPAQTQAVANSIRLQPSDVAARSRDMWTLQAAQDDDSISLQLVSRKPPVIQGHNGISKKGAAAGNASHYYSLTRLETTGKLRSAGQTYSVSGWSWMDHEFSTSSLDPQQTGWDWISLQMDDGSEWMLYQFRRKDGSRDPHSSGSFVDDAGRVTQLSAQDFTLTPLETWKSPHTGASYPVRWRVQIPSRGLDVEVSTTLRDQELDARETGAIYWEGAVEASGRQNGRPAHGRGYLELTGYAGPLPSSLYSASESRK